MSSDSVFSDLDFYEIASSSNMLTETRMKALYAMLSENENPLSALVQYFGKPDHIKVFRTFNADSFDSFFFGEMTSYVLFYSSISVNDIIAVSFDIGGRFAGVRWHDIPVKDSIPKWKGFLGPEHNKSRSAYIRDVLSTDKVLDSLVDTINETIAAKKSWTDWLIFLRGNDDILKFQVGAIKADPTSVIVSSVGYCNNVGWAILEFQFNPNRLFYVLVFFSRVNEQWREIPLNESFSSNIGLGLTNSSEQ